MNFIVEVSAGLPPAETGINYFYSERLLCRCGEYGFVYTVGAGSYRNIPLAVAEPYFGFLHIDKAYRQSHFGVFVKEYTPVALAVTASPLYWPSSKSSVITCT